MEKLGNNIDLKLIWFQKCDLYGFLTDFVIETLPNLNAKIKFAIFRCNTKYNQIVINRIRLPNEFMGKNLHNVNSAN